jgi:glycosyltransferase involved in cell wall biosynthesis
MARDGDMDGLPNVILEAMATGVPVVASRLSAIPEAITDGETGLLVPPGDAEALAAAIARVLQDRALAERLIAQARRRIETDFDIRCNVAALAACFEERKTG